MLLNLKVYSFVVSTDVFTVRNGAVNEGRTGSSAPDKFTWPYPTTYYKIECQISAPYSYSSFQGNVNGTALNAGSEVPFLLIENTEVQLGYIFQVFSPTAMPPQCSQFTIKYRIRTFLDVILVDWRETNLIRNDYLAYEQDGPNLLTVPDLFLQDKPFNPSRPNDPWDKGTKPSIDLGTYDYKWVTQSQDIWNRHYDDDVSSHINPMHSIQNPANTNYLYFTIRNRGCVSTNDAQLHLYWTIARFKEPWAHDWLNFNRGTHYADNKVVYLNNDYPMGNEITLYNTLDYTSSEQPITIAGLAPGATYTYRHPWVVPNPIWYKNGTYVPKVGNFPIQFSSENGNPVICLLARLDEPWRTNNGYDPNPALTAESEITSYVADNNNVVTRNTHILNSSGGYKWQTAGSNPRGQSGMLIANPEPGENPDPIHIGIKRDTSIYDTTMTPPVFTNNGQINIYLDELLWERWVDGGMEGRNIEVIDDQIIKVTDANFASLENIQLDEGEFGWMAAETEYYENNPPAANYDYAFAVGSLDINSDMFTGTPTHFIGTVLSEPTIEDNEGGDYFTTGINAFENINDQVKVYPNPANSIMYVHFKLTNAENIKVEIFTLQGKIVQGSDENAKIGNNVLKFNIDNLENGAYFIKISGTDKNLVQRFIISR